MQSALAKVDEIELKNADTKSRSATIEVSEGFDYKAALNKIVEGGNKHVKGWSVAE